MSELRKVVKVFLASPGDLSEERKAAKAVVDEINVTLAGAFGFQVELIGWEDTVSVYGRPQEIINRDLEGCELFVGVMWKHWGTPPDLSGKFSSGFEEEFETTVKRREFAGAPEMSLFFKEISGEYLRDPGDGLKKVLAFKDKLIREKKILFENFSNTREFEGKLRRCISSYVLKLIKVGNTIDPQRAPTPKNGEDVSEPRDVPSPFSAAGAAFISNFLEKTNRSSKDAPVTPMEIARFRLLASIVGGPANDKIFLGAHDANLIYVHASGFQLGSTEIFGLVRAGLYHFNNENVPIWKWYSLINKTALPFLSVDFDNLESVNVLRLMRLICASLPLKETDRAFFLRSWFGDESPTNLKNEALSYLAMCGIADDCVAIRAEYERNPQTLNRAAEALIRLAYRNGREKAVLTLYELQPSVVDKELAATIFDDGLTLSDELLLQGTSHGSPEVRKLTVNILSNRGSLPEETATALLNDAEPQIRFEALESLNRRGRNFTLEAANRILINSKETAGLFSLSYEAEAYWEQYQEAQLRMLNDTQLVHIIDEEIFFDKVAYFVLAERRFNVRRLELVASVQKEYQDDFMQRLDLASAKFNNPDVIEGMKSLEETTRRTWTRQALDIICKKSDKRDLPLLRNVLRGGFIGISPQDLRFLRKYGEWEDVALVIGSIQRLPVHYNLHTLNTMQSLRSRLAVGTILELGHGRLQETLLLAENTPLLHLLIANCSDVVFRGLDDDVLLRLLLSKNDVVRKAVALKCVKAYPRRRVVEICALYISGESQYFYNVLHWLDLGISLPRTKSLPIVSAAIQQIC